MLTNIGINTLDKDKLWDILFRKVFFVLIFKQKLTHARQHLLLLIKQRGI